MIVSFLRLQILQMAKQRQINDIHKFGIFLFFSTTINYMTSKIRFYDYYYFCVCACMCVRLCKHVLLSIIKSVGKIYNILCPLSSFKTKYD